VTERRVLLDTSVLITPPADGVASIADLVAVSAISVAELEYGVDATDDAVERQRRRRLLRVVRGTLEVIPFDDEVASSYGMLANLVREAQVDQVERNPRPRRLDLLIAATAERHGLSLATRNPEDFKHLERVLDVIAVI
jgi:predicted nucleic acid-binding protein